MKQSFILLTALLLAACASPSEPRKASKPGMPDTRELSGEILPVEAPVFGRLQSMLVWNLLDRQAEALDIHSYGDSIRTREQNGCVWTRGIDWFAPSDSFANCSSSTNWRTATAKVSQEQSMFPLRVGSRGSYHRRAVSNTKKVSERTTRCRVRDAVEVVLPSRQAVAAYEVRCDDGRVRRTTWYAPDLGPVAYREVHRKKGVRDAWVRVSL